MLKRIKRWIRQYIHQQIPEYEFYRTVKHQVTLGKHVRLYDPVRLYYVVIGDYSYVGIYSHLKNVEIGKFCSIGPKCFFGWGIHPIDGISTSPMFYSTKKQNGFTLSKTDKVVEQKKIIIGNDVFIGMNVTILDGVRIGNGAVIGAGAVVSKDVPDYAVAVGNPMQILKYRFPQEIRDALLQSKWWDFDVNDLKSVEENFFDVESFIRKINNSKND
jgi:virginiamycin A acetyltransferase